MELRPRLVEERAETATDFDPFFRAHSRAWPGRPLSGVSSYAMRPDGSDVVRLLDGGEVALLPGSWTS